VKNKRAFLLCLFIISVLCKPVLGDIVRLKDGRSYEGEIVEEDDESIKIQLDMTRGAGYITVQRDEIRRIVRETPQERQRKIEEQMRARGLVQDGDEWITPEEKASRDAQRQAEEQRKAQDRARYQREIDKLKEEQKQLQYDDRVREGLERSRTESTTILRGIVFKLIFFAILAAIAFTLLKRYFWD
jgi:hypothetical protein